MPDPDLSNGPFYLLEVQDGVETQRVLVTLDIGTLDVKVRVPGGGVSVTPGTFESLALVLIREDGEALFTWPINMQVQKGDIISLPTITLQ